MATTIEHNEAKSRYEIFFDGELAGYAEYAERGGVRDFNHTLTLPQFRGHGVAAQVVEHALTDTRAVGSKVRASCWYVDEYIATHREFADLVG
ncbi:N-acetyltransferase [Aldersonia sp. NBC_00410]|uniref:GNAT family N-acetyltransferase n=1 Tax=Aldersonia sp. NBC_00410 TaxID=2975954 RepID=UPI00224DC641|nr:GNAT family N-acetyltransferase [Aldersonia sp. NBC_00410]MCX5043643.1 N-acetyltransferase [Aldersonia sp. NBC_00410]